MPIRVKLFASLREQAGWSERPVEPDVRPATPLSLWRQLGLSAAACSPRSTAGPDNAADEAAAADSAWGDPGATDRLPQGIRVAINQAFASPETPLADGDELAFLPPISGG